ncbi:MAG: dihydroorotate dehydrogenase (quinone), partial [Actinomycetota bacterium]
MGFYRSLARPLLFTLPPETAHHTAERLLRLPAGLIRTASGASPSKVAGPRLFTQLAGIELRNPIGLAAGFDKRAKDLPGLAALGFGYLVVGTVTRQARAGNPRPRMVRRPEHRGLVNSMGLPNDGPEAVAARLERVASALGEVPVFVSLGDEALDDVVASHEILARHAAAIELNVSCRNVQRGRDRDNEEHLAEMLAKIVGLKPVFVKLPPFETPEEVEAVTTLAKIAADGGAAGLTCSNTRPVAEPGLATGAGGLSGAELFTGTLRIIASIR